MDVNGARDDLRMTPESIGSHSELRSIPAGIISRARDAALLNAFLLGRPYGK